MSKLVDKAELMNRLAPYWTKAEMLSAINNAPTIDAISVIRCNTCRFFEKDHIENFEGIPLIAAHNVCLKWGNGCVTAPDGYCFLAERRE